MITILKPMKFAALTAIIMVLAACGQKGALYLPKDKQEQQPKTEKANTTQSEQDKKNTEQ